MSPGWIVASIAGLAVGALGVVILRHNLRLRALRRRVAALSDEEYDGLLEAIDTFAPERATACLLVDTARERRTSDRAQLSRIGGAPPGGLERFSSEDGGGARFLMQIHVPEWLESSPWRGDLIAFFFSRKPYGFAGVRQPAPHDGLDAADSALAEALPIRWLRTVRVPRVPHGAKKHKNLFAPRMLLQHVPRLSERVASLSPDPRGFLTAVLAPTSWCEELDMFERIQVGGSPQWVQSPATPQCEVCGRSLKFIAQVGCDASNAFRGTGFIGVFYAFGCETHLDRIACVAQYT